MHEFLVDGGVSEDVDDQGLEGCACGIRACEQYEEDFGFNVVWVEWLTLLVAGVDEALYLPLVSAAEQEIECVIDLRLQQINPPICLSFFNIPSPLLDQLIPESHECANATLLLWSRNQILVSNPCSLDPLGERVKPSHESKRNQSFM